jgi:O-antigen/teichoic acid export membrane protein
MGFAYWALAARMFSQRAVGYGSASVSAMTLLGIVGMLGLGTVLIGELPRRTVRGGLISAALVTSGLGSLVLGLVFVLVGSHISYHFRNMSSTLAQATLFAAGVMLTGASLVFDQATIGLLRGGLQLLRNLAFAAAKLAILPACAIILHDQFGVGITLSWVTATALSLLLVALRLRLAGTSVLPRPNWHVLRGLGGTAIAHSWLNLAITVPRSLMPVLVTVIVSPSANAAFYAAWTLSGFLYLVPTHLATVLFAVASADPQKIARKLRFSLRLSVVIGVLGMAALGLGAHLALSMFGASYERAATVPLLLLLIGYLPSIPKVHYIAVCRATGRIKTAAAVLTVAATLEVAAAAAGGASGGMKGLILAFLFVLVLEGLVTTPAVVRAAIGHGRHRRAGPVHVATGKPLGTEQARGERSAYQERRLSGHVPSHQLLVPASVPAGRGHEADAADRRARQGEGISALLSLAQSASVYPPQPPPN